MDKVFSTGINKYSGAPLSGCVNDILDSSECLSKNYQVNEDNIRLLVDERATKKEIINRCEWLVDGTKAGDRILFHFSGHGSQVAARNGSGEVDGLAEIICPVDMAWDPDHYITDFELYQIFKNIPEGVKFVWINDSCHSGGMSRIDRDFHNPPIQVPRFLKPPEDIMWRIKVASQKKLVSTRDSKSLNVSFISGCRSDQTSADTVINGRPCGAMTHYFLKNLENMRNKPFRDVVAATVSGLKKDHYSQEPQAEGSLIDRPFWGDAVAESVQTDSDKPCKRRWYFPWTWWCKG